MIAPSSERIDKWLWRARFFKTRTRASLFADEGRMRIKRGDHHSRIEKCSHNVQVGDVLTFQIGTEVKVIEIAALGERRGPAAEAMQLYTDLTPSREGPYRV